MKKFILFGLLLLPLFSLNAQTKQGSIVFSIGYTNDFGVNTTLGLTSINSELSFTLGSRGNIDSALIESLVEYRYILEPDGVLFSGDKVDFQIRGIGGIGYQWSYAPILELLKIRYELSNFAVLFGVGGEARFGSNNSITPIIRLNFINYYHGGYYSSFSWFEPNISAGIKIKI